MKTPRAELRIPGGELVLGELPRVVGTFSGDARHIGKGALEEVSDIVEIRLDEIEEMQDWLDRCRAIEARGLPVVLTIRLDSEGGKWKGSEPARLMLYEKALDHLSCVDVEFRSEIAVSVSQRARRLGKASIVSYHDFERTPPLPELQSVLSEAQRIASVVKIATLIHDDADIEILRNLLGGGWEVPICVMGMGPLGAQTRISFATMGSCLTYGYLDQPVAPGQPAAAELVSQLRALLPKYNEDYLLRRQTREGAKSARFVPAG